MVFAISRLNERVGNLGESFCTRSREYTDKGGVLVVAGTTMMVPLSAGEMEVVSVSLLCLQLLQLLILSLLWLAREAVSCWKLFSCDAENWLSNDCNVAESGTAVSWAESLLLLLFFIVDMRRVGVGGCLGGLHPGSTDLCLQGTIGTVHIPVDVFQVRMHPVPLAAVVGGGYLVVRHECWQYYYIELAVVVCCLLLTSSLVGLMRSEETAVIDKEEQN